METVLNILTQLSDVAIVVLTIGFIVLSFLFSDTISQVVKQKLGMGRDYNDGKPVTTIPDLANQLANFQKEFFSLKEYVNHRQTEVLMKQSEILLKITDQLEDQGKLLEKIVDKMDKHDEMERKNNAAIQEMMKYGVPLREK